MHSQHLPSGQRALADLVATDRPEQRACGRTVRLRPLASSPQVVHRQAERCGQVNLPLGALDLRCPWVERPVDRDLARHVGDAEELRPLPLARVVGARRGSASTPARSAYARGRPIGKSKPTTSCSSVFTSSRERRSSPSGIGAALLPPTTRRDTLPVATVTHASVDQRPSPRERRSHRFPRGHEGSQAGGHPARRRATAWNLPTFIEHMFALFRRFVLGCGLRLPLRFTDHSDWRM